MAEFVEVMRHKERMCEQYGDVCGDCRLRRENNGRELNCPEYMACYAEEAEKIITEWAAAHPEPKYPSWNEAWKQLFPDAYCTNSPCPNHFLPKERSMPCDYWVCTDCKSQPTPADIAEKLGIKPLEE